MKIPHVKNRSWHVRNIPHGLYYTAGGGGREMRNEDIILI
jgi:hypothetical protein